jgi:hypothetical protein
MGGPYNSTQHIHDDTTRSTSESYGPNTETHLNRHNNNWDINTDDTYQEFQKLFPTNSQAEQQDDEAETTDGDDDYMAHRETHQIKPHQDPCLHHCP